MYIDWARTDNGYYDIKAVCSTPYTIISTDKSIGGVNISPTDKILIYVYNSDDTLKAVLDAKLNILLLLNENYY